MDLNSYTVYPELSGHRDGTEYFDTSGNLAYTTVKSDKETRWAWILLFTVIMVILVIIIVWILWPKSISLQRDTQITTGLSNTRTTLPVPAAAGQVCGDSIPCVAGTSCVLNGTNSAIGVCRRNLDQPCNSLAECVPQATICLGASISPGGAVTTGVCKSEPVGGLGQPGPCRSPYQVDSTGICRAPTGTRCSSNIDCITGVCTNQVCASKRTLGQSCQAGAVDQCNNGLYCSNGYCQNQGQTTGQAGAYCNVTSNPICGTDLACINNVCIDAPLTVGDTCDPTASLCRTPLQCNSSTLTCQYNSPTNQCSSTLQCLANQSCNQNTQQCQGTTNQPCQLASQCNNGQTCSPDPQLYFWSYLDGTFTPTGLTNQLTQLKSFYPAPSTDSTGQLITPSLTLAGLANNTLLFKNENDCSWIPANITNLGNNTITLMDFLPGGTLLVATRYPGAPPKWRLQLVSCVDNQTGCLRTNLSNTQNCTYKLTEYGNTSGYQYGFNGASSMLLSNYTSLSVSSKGDILLTAAGALWRKTSTEDYFQRIETDLSDIVNAVFYPGSPYSLNNYAFARSNNTTLTARGTLAGQYSSTGAQTVSAITGLALTNGSGVVTSGLLVAMTGTDLVSQWYLIQLSNPQNNTGTIQVYPLPGYFSPSFLISSPNYNAPASPVNPTVVVWNQSSCI